MTKAQTPVQDDKIDTPVLIYVLYLSAVFIPLFTALIGMIWAYIEKAHAPEWLQTHYEFMIHTFWKGFLFMVVGILLSVVFIGYLVLLCALVWWAVRCIKGVQLLRKKEAVPDPKTWLF